MVALTFPTRVFYVVLNGMWRALNGYAHSGDACLEYLLYPTLPLPLPHRRLSCTDLSFFPLRRGQPARHRCLAPPVRRFDNVNRFLLLYATDRIPRSVFSLPPCRFTRRS